MARFLLLRPEANKGRRVACGYQVDNELGEHGGFYVDTEPEAQRIVAHLTKWSILGWRYEAEKPDAPAESVEVEAPQKAPRPLSKKARARHALQAEARVIMAHGGPKINLNSSRRALKAYVMEHQGAVEAPQ